MHLHMYYAYCAVPQVDRAMSIGMVHITWSSLNVGIFLRRVEEAIVQFEIFSKQVHMLYVLVTCIA